MAVIEVTFRDEIHLRVKSAEFVEKQLEEYFSFDTPSAEYIRNNEFVKWDGTYRLYYPDSGKMYVGLLPSLMKFAEEHGHTIKKYKHLKDEDGKPMLEDIYIVDAPDHYVGSRVDEGQFREWLDGLEMPNETSMIQEHETVAILNVLRRNRAVMLIRPEDDKHPVLYCLLQWFLKERKKCLFIVWSKGAVERLYKRFEMTDHLQKLYYPLSKSVEKPILMASWQSVYKQPEKWFDRFDAVIVDEANKFVPKTFIPMMEKMTMTKHRIQIVNSKEKPKVHPKVQEGLFGLVEKVWDKEKPEEYLSNLNVTCLHLNYPDAIKEQVKDKRRHEEIKFLQRYEKRNNYIRNLACALEGNALMLVMNLDHGKVLYDLIQEKKQREGLKKAVFMNEVPTSEGDNDEWIVIASYRKVYDGFRISSLDSIIFSSPYKNEIRNLRSIGSGLEARHATCDLYDLADDLSVGDRKNHLIRNANKRMKAYKKEKEQGLSVKIVRVTIE